MKTDKESRVRSPESRVRNQGHNDLSSTPDSRLRTHDSRLFETVYERLRAWCRARGYAGHDPFDALSSRLFRATPLRRSRLARLAWTQTFKRLPVNLRKLALVPEERNPKGTALFGKANGSW